MSEPTMSDYHEAIFLSGSSYSSFSSDSSSTSCGKSSPHPSSLGLRRSTMDLSDLDSSGFPSQTSLSSKHLSSSACSSQGKGDWPTRRFPSTGTSNVKRKHHRGIEAIVHDTFFDTLSVIDLTTAFSNMLSKIFHKQGLHSDDGRMMDAAINVHHRANSSQRCRSVAESKVDDNFSPCQIHISQLDCSDDWDHFADFQDRMGEEVIAFTPFTARKPKVKLDTLNEIEEEEEDMDVFSF